VLRLNLLIQATERVTAPIRRIQQGLRRMATDGARGARQLGSALDRLRSIAGRTGAAAGRALQGGFARAFARIRSMASNAIRGVGSIMRGGLVGIGAGITAAAGALLYQLTVGTIGTASQFEQFSIILGNTERSAEGARRAVAWIQDFATRTPYELADVVEGFKPLRLINFNPMQGSLESIGNAAAAMGRPLLDAVEAVSGALRGEFDPLEGFGIFMGAEGARRTVRYYDQAGREIRRTISGDARTMERELSRIFNEKFPSMMQRQSASAAGLWANLLDMATNFQLRVANAGLFDFVKTQLRDLLSYINNLATNGTLQEWAQQISDKIVRAATVVSDWVRGGGLQRLGDQLLTVAQAVRDVSAALVSMADSIRSLPSLPDWFNAPRAARRFEAWLRSDPAPAPAPAPLRAPLLPRLLPRGAPQARPGDGSMLRPQGGPSRAPMLRLGPPARTGAGTPRPRAAVQDEVLLKVELDPRLRTSEMAASSNSRNVRSVLNVRRGTVGMASG
jgi:hypothetical protein